VKDIGIFWVFIDKYGLWLAFLAPNVLNFMFQYFIGISTFILMKKKCDLKINCGLIQLFIFIPIVTTICVYIPYFLMLFFHVEDYILLLWLLSLGICLIMLLLFCSTSDCSKGIYNFFLRKWDETKLCDKRESLI